MTRRGLLAIVGAIPLSRLLQLPASSVSRLQITAGKIEGTILSGQITTISASKISGTLRKPFEINDRAYYLPPVYE